MNDDAWIGAINAQALSFKIVEQFIGDDKHHVVNREEINRAQQGDEAIQKVIKTLEEGKRKTKKELQGEDRETVYLFRQ